MIYRRAVDAEETEFDNAGSRLSTVSRDLASVEKVVAAVQEGQTFEMERAFTTQDVASYVSLCGDTNPIHTCDSTAQSAGFQGRVVQGMLYAGLFPAIIGSHFVSEPKLNLRRFVKFSKNCNSQPV